MVPWAGVTDDAGVRVASTYDPRNLLAGLTWTGGGVAGARAGFGYDGNGRRSAATRFADAAGMSPVGTSYTTYDSLGRVASLTHKGPGGLAVAEYSYDYDPAGRLVAWAINGAASSYSYDPTGQLIGADHPTQPDEGYVYDANGNRVGGGSVVGPGNRLLADGTFTYGYDDEGNTISKTEVATGAVTVYEYDYRNRLVSVVVRDGNGAVVTHAEYAYDGFDRRVLKTVNGVAAATVYDGGNVWADFDGSGTVTARYLTGDRLDEMVARWRPADGTGWYLTDHLGTVRDVTDAAGAVANHVEYDSFGNMLSETGPAAGDRFKFTGQDYDAETGLYWYWHRMYDPSTGRFLSADPLRFSAGDYNLARYVGNKPLLYVDPEGTTETTSEAAFADRMYKIAEAIYKFRHALLNAVKVAKGPIDKLGRRYISTNKQVDFQKAFNAAYKQFFDEASKAGLTGRLENGLPVHRGRA